MMLMIEALEARIKQRKAYSRADECWCDHHDDICARCRYITQLNEDLSRIARVRVAIADIGALAERYDKA